MTDPEASRPAKSPPPANVVDIRALLTRALRRRFGAGVDVDDIVVPTLGGSNRTVLFDCVDGTARRRLASRQITVARAMSPFLSASDQFRVMSVARAHGFPVPEPLFEYDELDGMGTGFVTAFVAGETMPRRIVADPAFASIRAGLADQVGVLMATLHRIPPEEVAFLAAVPDSEDALAAQISRYDHYAEAHPALETGLRWLTLNRPPHRPATLVHGDFRTGNITVGAGGVTSVLDWECAHFGSPIEDLGWMCARSWRFGRPDLPVGGFGRRHNFYCAYAAAGGGIVEPEEVRYWEIFGLVRWAILNMMQAHGHVREGRSSVVFAACGRNTSLVEYDLLMTLSKRFA